MVLALVGFIARRLNVITAEINSAVATIIIKITTPFLILVTLSNFRLTPKELTNGATVFFSAFLVLLTAGVIGFLFSNVLKLEGARKNIFRMAMIFGNIVFMAYPLYDALFPNGTGLFYAVFYTLANDILLWTLGIYLINKHTGAKVRENLKYLINSNTVAFAIGLVILFTGMKQFAANHGYMGNVYNSIFDIVRPLGNATVPLSMLFIGANLAGMEFKSTFKDFSILVYTLFKLLLIPIGVLLILSLIGVTGIVKQVIVMQSAMPCAIIVATLAKQYDSDHEFATRCIFISTILCVLTIPLLVWILR